MPGYTYFDDLVALLPDAPEDSILSRTFFTEDGMKGILFRFAAGQELSEHTSSQAAVMHFLEGEAAVTLGGESFEARPGAWAHMAPRLPHSIVARTPVTMLLLMYGG